MKMICFVCFALLLRAVVFPIAAQDLFTNDAAIKTFLHENFDGKNYGMVIGLLDEHGGRIFGAGKLDNGTEQTVNGDTIFEIGSITKTFTDLLLLDMVEHGEMKLDDPVVKYLPKSVKIPSRGGKEITLLNLAVQDSGLPFNPTNFSSKNLADAYDAYTVGDLCAFLAGFVLPDDPGAKFQYSNLGQSLLGHVMELKAGTNFESLVLSHISHPLHLDSTRIVLPSDLTSRAAVAHDESGRRVPNYHLQVMEPAGGLRSSANDLLKYLSANLGFMPTHLMPLMEKMQVIRHRDNPPPWGKTAMPWMDEGVYNPPGTELLGHAGGTFGSRAFIGFDKRKRRGIVVLQNHSGGFRSGEVGWRILQNASINGLNPADLSALHETIGVGIALALDKQTGKLQINKVFPNTPATQANLSSGFFVTSIDGISTTNKTLENCLKLIRGEAGTKVRLELATADASRTITVELTRQKILF
jgi:CubicO group peptidase (beta-lactamase class C family)